MYQTHSLKQKVNRSLIDMVLNLPGKVSLPCFLQMFVLRADKYLNLINEKPLFN